MNKLRIAIACGGTGGHTFPGLAVANTLRKRGHEITVFQAGRAIESQTLRGWDGAIFKTGAVQRPARHPLATLKSLVRTAAYLSKNPQDVVLAMGSYASLTPVKAARWRLHPIPVVLHEANAIPGNAISYLSKCASAVAISFDECEKWLKCKNIQKTGLPVREELLSQIPFGGCDRTKDFTILVTGGSQGARAINDLASKAIISLAQNGEIKNLKIIHQTGKADEAELRERYAAAGVDAVVVAFLREMGSAMKAANLAIARAGAATCAELAMFGLPSILIPLPSAVRDHQYANAKFFAEVGAAKVIRQNACDEEWLRRQIVALAQDHAALDAMRIAALAAAMPDATEKLAMLVERTASIKSHR